MKKLLAIVLVLMMVLGMVACGGGEDDVITYKVLTEATFPPFDTVDEDGNIIGFDMDLISAIAEDQGFAVEFVDMPFESLIPALEAGNGDIIAAGMWCGDPERAEKVDFSDVYYTGGKAILVAADNNEITGEDSFTPETVVASQIGSNYADEITALKEEGKIKEAVILDGFDVCVLQLINGDIDAVVSGNDVVNAYIKQHEGKIKLACDIESSEDMGFAVQKGNLELLEKINTGLQNVKDSGVYDELIIKWMVGEE